MPFMCQACPWLQLLQTGDGAGAPWLAGTQEGSEPKENKHTTAWRPQRLQAELRRACGPVSWGRPASAAQQCWRAL